MDRKHLGMGDGKWIGIDHESAESQKYVGMKRSDVLLSAQHAGIPIRVLEDRKKNVLTADLNPRRLTVLVLGETVVKAAFF
jgi:hypothetical protein